MGKLLADFETAMCERLRLFNVIKSAEEIELDESLLPANEYRARAHVAWGAFNWTVLHSSFYKGLPMMHPPTYYPPEYVEPQVESLYHCITLISSRNAMPYLGNTFAALCKFRVIHAGVVTDDDSLESAERRYHQFLNWADHLRALDSQRQRSGTPHHVLVLHIWLHTNILNIFRPFISKGAALRTFTTNSTPEAISEASLMQLKYLVVEYWQSQPSAQYNILWHPSLLYIGNAVLQNPRSTVDWRFYFDLCLDAYLQLYTCYQVAAGFLQGYVCTTSR